MTTRPTAIELLEAVRRFVEREVVPALDDDGVRFRARVAANALAIVVREAEADPAELEREIAELARVLEVPDAAATPEAALLLERELARRIRAGEAPEGTLELVRRSLARRLAVAHPGYLERYER